MSRPRTCRFRPRNYNAKQRRDVRRAFKRAMVAGGWDARVEPGGPIGQNVFGLPRKSPAP